MARAGVCERTAFEAEEFGLEQRLWDGRTVDVDEGPATPSAVAVEQRRQADGELVIPGASAARCPARDLNRLFTPTRERRRESARGSVLVAVMARSTSGARATLCAECVVVRIGRGWKPCYEIAQEAREREGGPSIYQSMLGREVTQA